MAADGLTPTGVRVNILGPVALQPGAEGRPAQPVPGRNARTLLAALAARSGRPVRREALIVDLWGDKPAGTSENLRLAVMRLRSAFATLADLDGERAKLLVATVADGYQLALQEPDDLDAARFERLLREAGGLASAGDVSQARARIHEALALWRADPLPELAGTDVGEAEGARLRDLHEQARDVHFELALAAGDHASLPSQIEAALVDQPYRESRWGHLMVALYRNGRQADALAAYQRARHLLIDDLGLEPGPDLRRLEAAVLAQDPALDASPTPPAPDAAAPSQWIERQRELTLVGRQDTLARLWEGWHRVIETSSGGVALIDGDAGVGKTRLAAELAHGVIDLGGRVIAARCVRGAGLAALVPSLDQLELPVEAASLVPGSPALVGVAHHVAHELRFGRSSLPTLLVLEDAHCLDEQMVAVFGDLGDRPWPAVNANPNLVLVLSERGWPSPPGTARMASAIDRLSWQDHVVLDVLPDDEVRALVVETLRATGRTSPLSDVAIDEIVAASGGNARVLVELARAERRPAVPSATTVIPESLRKSLAERLERQSPEVVDVVLNASIIGQEVDLHTLDLAGGAGRERSLALLEAAVAARLLDEVPERPGHFRFLNRVERELALERVSLTRRRLVEDRLTTR